MQGVGVEVAVGVGVGVNVAVAVGVGVNVAVAVGVGVGLAVAVAVGVEVGVAVGDPELDGRTGMRVAPVAKSTVMGLWMSVEGSL